MKIRVAEPEDAAEICVVLRRAITELCVADHRYDPEILQPWLGNKTETNLRDWTSRSGQIYYVAVIDGTIAGVGAVSAADGILLNYVSPDYQYRGVSKAIMKALEVWLIQQGQTSSRLHSTSTARSFYEKIGYLPNGEPETRKTGLVSFPMIKQLG